MLVDYFSAFSGVGVFPNKAIDVYGSSLVAGEKWRPWCCTTLTFQPLREWIDESSDADRKKEEAVEKEQSGIKILLVIRRLSRNNCHQVFQVNSVIFRKCA